MGKGDRMERVDMTKEFPNLRDADKHFIRKLESMNTSRVKDLKGLRKRNGLTGVLLASGVLGIYFYSMYAVRQERFLDDFDTVPPSHKES